MSLSDEWFGPDFSQCSAASLTLASQEGQLS